MNIDKLVDEGIKDMDIKVPDITSAVMTSITNKKTRVTHKRLLVFAALFVMTFATVFASNWIDFKEDGTYIIKSEDKQWQSEFDIKYDNDSYLKYVKLSEELNIKANRDGVDYMGYLDSSDYEKPFYLVSNSIESYDRDHLDDFHTSTEHEWIGAVEKSMPDEYDFYLAIVQNTFPAEYLNTWYDQMEIDALEDQLYYEEVVAERSLFNINMSYFYWDSQYMNTIKASITTESSFKSSDSELINSEILIFGDYQGVYSVLKDEFIIIELVYKGNLLSVSGKVKTDSKELMSKIISDIISELERNTHD